GQGEESIATRGPARRDTGDGPDAGVARHRDPGISALPGGRRRVLPGGMTMERVRHRTAMRGRGGHGGWVAVQGLIAVAVGVLAFPEVTVRALALLLGIGLSLLGLAGILVRGRAPSYARWRSTVFPGGERGRRAAVPSATVRAGAVVLRRRGQ